MARPLRMWMAGGWYHVTARGNRQEAIYRTDVDRRRFLGLLEGMVERFGVEVHAFVLMDNHYHLVVRTPEPNLSEAMRWLQLSYTSRFNWAHRQKGHLFQGRFKAIVIETIQGVVEVARYVHLNPVRVGGKEFAQRLLEGLKGKKKQRNREEQRAVREMERADRLAWEEIVKEAEELREVKWEEMKERWGDWSRDGTIYVAVRHGRHRLSDVVRTVGGMTYGASAQAMRRFDVALKTDRAKRQFVEKLKMRIRRTHPKCN